jgi:hypothetical protein
MLNLLWLEVICCTFSALLMVALCEDITSEFSELVSIDILISRHTNRRGKLIENWTDESDIWGTVLVSDWQVVVLGFVCSSVRRTTNAGLVKLLNIWPTGHCLYTFYTWPSPHWHHVSVVTVPRHTACLEFQIYVSSTNSLISNSILHNGHHKNQPVSPEWNLLYIYPRYPCLYYVI